MGDARKSTVIRLCKAAIELDPNYARAWALLAIAQRNRLYAASTGDDGLAAATRALAIDPNLAEAHAARSGALAARGDYAGARLAISAALQLDPESPDVQRDAGRCDPSAPARGRRGHFEKAFDLGESDISSGGMQITCYTALGDARAPEASGRAHAERAEGALAKDAANGSAMAAMFSALLTLGQVDRAKEWARRAVLMDPENLGMRYNLACDLVVSARDFDAALDMLRPVCRSGGPEQLAWLIRTRTSTRCARILASRR